MCAFSSYIQVCVCVCLGGVRECGWCVAEDTAIAPRPCRKSPALVGGLLPPISPQRRTKRLINLRACFPGSADHVMTFHKRNRQQMRLKVTVHEIHISGMSLRAGPGRIAFPDPQKSWRHHQDSFPVCFRTEQRRGFNHQED